MITRVDDFSRHEVLNNTGVSLSQVDSVSLSATYFLNTHLAGEFTFGIGPEWGFHGAGLFTAFKNIGTARQWSPTLLLKYYFFEDNARLRPYIGLGGSLTWFTDACANEDFYGIFDGKQSFVSLSNAWSPVFNTGVKYQFDKNWFAGISASYMPLRTSITFATHTHPDGPFKGKIVTTETKIRLQAIIAYLNIGYRF